jgi:hypothetical protein
MSDYMVDRIAEDGEDFHSSNIDILGYDAKTETLYVEFHSSGTVYSYSGVKESTFDMLVNADSVGSFYARHIKGTYDSDVAGEGVITLREDDLSPQGDVKWLTTEGDESPFGPSDESNDFLDPILAPARYAVEYTVVKGDGPGQTFKPEFKAQSEADALSQFNEAVKSLETVLGWTDLTITVRSVTHYFD